jgi:hypothetical protein
MKIKAEELRIGNIIYDNEVGHKGDFKVSAGDILHIKTSLDHEYTTLELTEKWLLKFGFHQMLTKRNYYIKTVFGEMTADSIDFIFDLKNKLVCEDIGQMVIPIGRQVNRVHEFQNAYFWKTGEEITT